MDKEPSRFQPYLPLLLASFLLIGIFIGTRIPGPLPATGHQTIKRNATKISDLIRYIEENYVDTVNKQQLYDAATNGLLLSLDPHSSFIPASDFHEMTDPLKGNFEGIGIQFRMINDSLVVINTIPEGPSEKAGIKAGDRIISVEGRNITNIKMSDNDVIKKLKGPKGTQVRLGLFRRESPGIIKVVVTRDVIPTSSVDVAYMIQPAVGFLKISKFSATTTDEVTEALKRLINKGMTSLILDLRDNSGGYLQAAIDLAEQFLPEKKMIVYTEGRKRPRQTFVAGGKGLFLKGDLLVLINEGSASASEILAGAIQDNDRGTIIGRRSYGKGLVQEELDFKDGSAVRLTVARYYTPTGRCIQRPYKLKREDYTNEPLKRYLEDESSHPDSIPLEDSLKFTTPKGKVVYGGGGIMPDVTVPVDKDPHRIFFNKLVNSGLMYRYAFHYTDNHRLELNRIATAEAFAKNFIVTDQMVAEMWRFEEKNSIPERKELHQNISGELKSYIKSMIARLLFDDSGFYPIYNNTDKTVKTALDFLSSPSSHH